MVTKKAKEKEKRANEMRQFFKLEVLQQREKDKDRLRIKQ